MEWGETGALEAAQRKPGLWPHDSTGILCKGNVSDTRDGQGFAIRRMGFDLGQCSVGTSMRNL